MAFGDVLRLSLQPTALELDPGVARAQFLHDLNRQHRLGTGLAQQRRTSERAAFDRNLYDRNVTAARGFRSLSKREQHFKPSGNPNQYMVDAILRDNAVAQYDRDAPRLRAEDQARASR